MEEDKNWDKIMFFADEMKEMVRFLCWGPKPRAHRNVLCSKWHSRLKYQVLVSEVEELQDAEDSGTFSGLECACFREVGLGFKVEQILLFCTKMWAHTTDHEKLAPRNRRTLQTSSAAPDRWAMLEAVPDHFDLQAHKESAATYLWWTGEMRCNICVEEENTL